MTSRFASRRLVRRALAAATVSVLVASGTAATAGVEARSGAGPASWTSGGLLWGAWIGSQFTGTEAPWDWNAVTAFEQRNAGGKRLSVLHWSSPFSSQGCGGACRFDTAVFESVRARGVIPFLSWGSTGISVAALAAGRHDAYIRDWARAAKAWGHPFFVRFNWEMNGPWMSWGVGNNGTRARDYVASWRRVHGIFRSVGATNATWVWCPNIDPARSWARLSSVYPGDGYVDWTCLVGFDGRARWRTFESLYGSTYDRIAQRIAPCKPMIVGEVAATETGGQKPRFIRGMFAALPRRFPLIRGFLWFDVPYPGPGGFADWGIESSAASRAAFTKGIASPTYLEAGSPAVADSPIRPPSARPGVCLRATAEISMRRFLRNGLLVRTYGDERGTATVSLTAGVGGRRITVARTTAAIGASAPVRQRLQARGAVKRRLARQPFRLRVAARLVALDGKSSSARRDVRVERR